MLSNLLKGRKTYVVAIGVAIVAGLSALGIPIPIWVKPLAIALGLGSLRAGIKKGEFLMDEVEEGGSQTSG